MFTEDEFKRNAKALRSALARRDHAISHSQALDVLAEVIGEDSWNHLSAKFKQEPHAEGAKHMLPDGWSLTGRDVEHYTVCVLESGANKRTLEMKSSTATEGRFVALMQTVNAKQFLEKHVRMRARAKTTDVGNASLWVRVDDKTYQTLSFDNMKDIQPDRSLKGTNDWQSVELVLDVPTGAKTISFGSMLSGSGTAQFEDFVFEGVSISVPVSGKGRPDGPRNLGMI